MNEFLQRLDLQAQGIWLPLAFCGIVLLFVLLMPKRQINWAGIYFTFGVIGYVGLILDINILGEYFDLFDLGDPLKEGIGDLASYAIIPPCLAILFLNYFKPKSKWLYVAIFTCISYFFEWGLTQIGYMQLKGWRTWYSIPVYIAVYGLWLPWHFTLIKKVFDKKTEHGENAKTQPALKPLDNIADHPDNEG